MEKTYLFLAEGFEEMEAIAIVDVLRRGGVEVHTVSISGNKEVTSSHGVKVFADLIFDQADFENASCLIFPGGMPGAENLGNCKSLLVNMQQHYHKGRFIAAICAAPALVLRHLRAGKKVRLTCYPGFEKYLPEDFEVITDGVVVDGNVITGRGPGFAVRFGLKVLENICSPEVAADVAKGMLL